MKELIKKLQEEDPEAELKFVLGYLHESSESALPSEHIQVSGWDDGVHVELCLDDTEDYERWLGSGY